MNSRRIRVLIVDDSALARRIVSEALAGFSDIEVVGTAIDPFIARSQIFELNPDVVTLDLEMPRMDGLTFLKIIMKHRPMPVIILSSLTPAGSDKALEALQAGAVDVVGKPKGSTFAFEDAAALAEKIRAAASARVRRHSDPLPVASARRKIAPPVASSLVPAVRGISPRSLILLGASTGGTEALKAVLTALNGNLPGICVVQHISAGFSLAFANQLDRICPMEVREARHGDFVKSGLALIAPGGHHMLLKWIGGQYQIELNQGPQIHHQRPAADVLFDSAVKAGAAPHSIAALLTGMGRDGANGLLHLRQAGAATLAQNEETCVVFGMPREAIRLGAAQEVLALDQVARRVEQQFSTPYGHATEAA